MFDFQNEYFRKGYISGYRDGIQDAKTGKVLHWDGKDILSAPIQAMSVSPRAINCLLRAGCLQVSDVAALDESRIATMRNMGAKTASEIALWLDEHGIHLTAWSRYL